MASLFALVDCNNFYASCERLFRPALKGEPIVILSNNDGCVIARSNEAKALGVAMGEPFFKVKHLVATHGIHVFSSNYTLYGNLSRRVMTILRQLEPAVEVYSIDEAFIALPSSSAATLDNYGRQLKRTIERCVGIPVAIGIGATKTIAKVATRVAKKEAVHGGVCCLTEGEGLEEKLAACAVEDVWGIGPQSTRKLKSHGIITARELRDADDGWLRRRLTVTGLRTAMELRGVSCIPVERVAADKKSIISSRSFGCPVSTLADLRQAVATYLATAAEKLRGQGSLAGAVQVFITTNPFTPNLPQYAHSLTITLPRPSAHTPTLFAAAAHCLDTIYRPGYLYKKAGVMLTGLTSDRYQQQHLFGPPEEVSAELMRAVDLINNKWGRQTVRLAAAGFNPSWQMVQARKSPAYTTSWAELPVAHAG